MIYEAEDKSVPMYSGKWWAAEIASVEKTLDEKWRNSGDKVVEKYLNDEASDETGKVPRKYNIFWANVQIQKSALYATPPRPTVTRQHGDAKDDVARTAALMMQRILEFGITKDQSDM